jgi:hypothetical protein
VIFAFPSLFGLTNRHFSHALVISGSEANYDAAAFVLFFISSVDEPHRFWRDNVLRQSIGKRFKPRHLSIATMEDHQ